MKARFKCKDGWKLVTQAFKPITDQSENVLTCSFGNWTGETPVCQEGNKTELFEEHLIMANDSLQFTVNFLATLQMAKFSLLATWDFMTIDLTLRKSSITSKSCMIVIKATFLKMDQSA